MKMRCLTFPHPGRCSRGRHTTSAKVSPSTETVIPPVGLLLTSVDRAPRIFLLFWCLRDLDGTVRERGRMSNWRWKSDEAFSYLNADLPQR